MGLPVIERMPLRGFVPQGLIDRAAQQILARGAARRRRYRAIDEHGAKVMEWVRSETIKQHLELVRAFT